MIRSPALAGGVRGAPSPRFQLAACSAMHAVNDGLFAALYPLLPLIAAGLGLSYAEAGAVKTVFSGASAVFQVPAGVAAERAGEHLLLALGTGWVGVGLLGMAAATTFWPLLALTLFAGLGGNTQHPVATAIVSRAYDRAAPTGGEAGPTGSTGSTGSMAPPAASAAPSASAAPGRSRGWAIGTLNFAGDVGKMLAPLATGAAALAYGWRGGVLALGAMGVAGAVLYALLVPLRRADAPSGSAATEVDEARPAAGGGDSSLLTHHALPPQEAPEGPPEGVGWGIERPRAFTVLTLVGSLDAAARGASLTFIPFLLQNKGVETAQLSFFFTLLFAAGAAGKFICGPLGDRFGSVAMIAITELVTAVCLVALLGAPLTWSLATLIPLGFVLNGTSSVLYAAVAGLVHRSRRARGYGLYYTATQLASAAAPVLYGMLADRAGLGVTFIAMAAATALIVPLTLTTAPDLAGA